MRGAAESRSCHIQPVPSECKLSCERHSLTLIQNYMRFSATRRDSLTWFTCSLCSNKSIKELFIVLCTIEALSLTFFFFDMLLQLYFCFGHIFKVFKYYSPLISIFHQLVSTALVSVIHGNNEIGSGILVLYE
jgi:hypothetical protein